MSGRVENVYFPGQTDASDALTHLQGQVAEFPDYNWSSAEASKPLLSQMTVRYRWVQNDSGGALLPKLCVTYKSGNFGKEIGALAGDGGIVHGVVDPFLPAAGVADGKHFYIVEYGPAELTSDGGGVLAQNDIVVAAASGKVNIQTAAPANETAVMVQVKSVAGLAMEAAAAVDGTTFRAFINLPLLAG